MRTTENAHRPRGSRTLCARPTLSVNRIGVLDRRPRTSILRRSGARIAGSVPHDNVEPSPAHRRRQRDDSRRAQPCCVPDTSEQVRSEHRLGIGLIGVPSARVPSATALVGMRPGDRVIGAHRTAPGNVRRLVERGQHAYRRPRVGREVVPLVHARPRPRERCGRRMAAIGDRDRCALDVWVTREPRSEEPAVPGPVVLGVRGRMNADEAAAGTDEALESSLLGAGQDVAGRGEKHDGLVAREVGARERPRILGRVDARGRCARPSSRDGAQAATGWTRAEIRRSS